MGYYYGASIHGGKFPADKIEGALEAARILLGRAPEAGSGSSWHPGVPTVRHYSWVDTPRCLATLDLEDLTARPACALRAFLAEWRYSSTVKDDGSLQLNYFEGEKLGDEEQLWESMAPFMERTVIQCSGEDDNLWLWVIDGDGVHQVDGQITWPTAPDWATEMINK